MKTCAVELFFFETLAEERTDGLNDVLGLGYPDLRVAAANDRQHLVYYRPGVGFVPIDIRENPDVVTFVNSKRPEEGSVVFGKLLGRTGVV